MRKLCLVLTALLMMVPMGSGAQGESTDARKFKEEYEILNGQANMDGSHAYSSITIPDDNPVVYATQAQVKSLFSGGTGILYLGFPECPWCRTLVPVLMAAVDHTGYQGEIYYYNALAERDKRSLDEKGSIVVEKEGSEFYQYLLGELGDKIGAYEGLNDPTIKRIYFPTTVFVLNGEIKSVHLDTLPSQTDGYAPLSDAQYTELIDELKSEITAINTAKQ